MLYHTRLANCVLRHALVLGPHELHRHGLLGRDVDLGACLEDVPISRNVME
jgi:hypothetical protein